MNPEDAIPFILTPAERTRAAMARAHLEQQRRDANTADDARTRRIAAFYAPASAAHTGSRADHAQRDVNGASQRGDSTVGAGCTG